MIKPNFFIIGAPKCGTTSLASWLAEHPEIYFSPTKEPHYFNTDHRRFLNSLQGYERLFAGATVQHRAVGEASVWYMYSAAAVANILDYAGEAKFIVMLRNPIEMAPSLHEELVFTGREDVKEFAEAWSLQDVRRNGQKLPPMVWEPKYVQYGDLCSLGVQLDRVFRLVRKTASRSSCWMIWLPTRPAFTDRCSNFLVSATIVGGILPCATRRSGGAGADC